MISITQLRSIKEYLCAPVLKGSSFQFILLDLLTRNRYKYFSSLYRVLHVINIVWVYLSTFVLSVTFKVKIVHFHSIKVS